MDQVSLARVSVRAPICSRSTAAAAADGASPRTVPPSLVHAAASARMAVVFPAPAGAIASCSRAPEVAICAHQRGLSGVEGDPVRGLLEQRQVDRLGRPLARRAGRRRRPGAARRPGPLRVYSVGAGDRVDAGPVRPPQARARRCRRPWVRRTDRWSGPRRRAGPTSARRRARRAGRRRGPGAGPRRGRATSATWSGSPAARPGAAAVHPRRIHATGRLGGRGRPVHHRVDRARRPGPRCRFGQPRGALLGQGAWFVLGVAGLQGGLLGEVDRFHRWSGAGRGRPGSGGELAAAVLDVGPAGGPALVQAGVDADDLTDRPLRRVGAGPLGEAAPRGGFARCFSRAVL